MTKKIEMTQTEAAAAGKLNSNEFKDLKALLEMFPGFDISIVKANTKKANRFKGLNYAYMKAYIERKKPDLLSEFYELCGKDQDGNKQEIAVAASYGEIKMWFLTKFPEIEHMTDRVNDIIEEARKKRKNSESEKTASEKAAA
jgi:hypothetical protein